jgi:hypothetical protein
MEPRCTAFPAPPTASGSGVEIALLIKTHKGYEFCACGTGMTDVSLPIFPVEVQKKTDSDDR